MPGNSNAGHEFNDGPKGKGVIGRKLSEDETNGNYRVPEDAVAFTERLQLTWPSSIY